MKSNQRQQLFEQYSNKSNEELLAITHDESFEPYAREIAFEIINSDRSEYFEKQKQIEQEYLARNTSSSSKEKTVFKVNDAIFQIAKDVHFIRNVITIELVATAISAVITFIYLIIEFS